MNSPYALLLKYDSQTVYQMLDSGELSLPEPYALNETPLGVVVTRKYEDVFTTWIPYSENISIGHNAPLTPQAMAREEMVDGFAVDLSNRTRWLLPIIDNIPGKICYKDGKWINQPEGRYRPLVDQAFQFKEILSMSFVGEVEQDVPLGTVISYCMELLKANYWICEIVADYMEIFDDSAIVRAACCGSGWSAEAMGITGVLDLMKMRMN